MKQKLLTAATLLVAGHLRASVCGQGGAATPAVECPPDLSQADLYQHPGCKL